MVRPGLKRAKRVQRRTPGGRTVTHYKKKRRGPALCAICGSELSGVPRVSQARLKRLPKSKRKPERPFGGALCTRCTRYILSLRAQLKYGEIKKSDIPISLMSYVLGK